MTHIIYEVSKGQQYSLVKERDHPLFKREAGWKYSQVFTSNDQNAVASLFRTLYIEERSNYFFIDYL